MSAVGGVAIACATAPRGADGPRPALGPAESIEVSGRPSVATAEPAPSYRPPRSGPFCREVIDLDGAHSMKGICDDAGSAP